MITQTPRRSFRIAPRAVKQGARSAVCESPMQFKISARDHKVRILKSKESILMSTLSVRTLNNLFQTSELVANALYVEMEYQDVGKGWTHITSSALKEYGKR